MPPLQIEYPGYRRARSTLSDDPVMALVSGPVQVKKEPGVGIPTKVKIEPGVSRPTSRSPSVAASGSSTPSRARSSVPNLTTPIKDPKTPTRNRRSGISASRSATPRRASSTASTAAESEGVASNGSMTPEPGIRPAVRPARPSSSPQATKAQATASRATALPPNLKELLMEAMRKFLRFAKESGPDRNVTALNAVKAMDIVLECLFDASLANAVANDLSPSSPTREVLKTTLQTFHGVCRSCMNSVLIKLPKEHNQASKFENWWGEVKAAISLLPGGAYPLFADAETAGRIARSANRMWNANERLASVQRAIGASEIPEPKTEEICSLTETMYDLLRLLIQETWPKSPVSLS